MAQSVTRLIKHGHRLEQIADYSLDKFMIFLDAVEQLDAEARIGFVTDMTAVVGSLFSKDPIVSEHLDSLRNAQLGVRDGSD